MDQELRRFSPEAVEEGVELDEVNESERETPLPPVPMRRDNSSTAVQDQQQRKTGDPDVMVR